MTAAVDVDGRRGGFILFLWLVYTGMWTIFNAARNLEGTLLPGLPTKP
jgi:hypothetical protein